ncbi:MAG: GDSL-type esterase/lipase family protein [Cyclobacteriaceae bacterium]
MNQRIICFVLLLLTGLTSLAQDPTRYQAEIDAINKLDIPKDGIIFTGSSSIRLWPNLNDWFPQVEVYNLGFGGSETSELLYHANDLIIKHQPRKVFIYEGDNDVNSGKSATRIITDMELLVRKIEEESPTTEIILISAKPSEERWHLKAKYEEYNEKLEAFCTQNDLAFIDVWSPMMDENEEIKPNLFKEDPLHMNENGYKIWQALISPYVN